MSQNSEKLVSTEKAIPRVYSLLFLFKVIPLKLFYYQTFFETWRNEHSCYEHYKNAIKIWGHPCLFTRQ